MKSRARLPFALVVSLVAACSTEQGSSDAGSSDGASDAFVAHDTSTAMPDALPDAALHDAFTGPDAFVQPDAFTCVPSRTCASEASNCGTIDDGCGTMIPCGDCSGTSTCAGDGVANVCSVPVCTRHVCAAGECGLIDDGCGAMVSCGGCMQPQSCGGDGTPNVCGVAATCTDLCLQLVTCTDPAVTTTLTGRVYAPNGVDPLPNVIVYVPNAALSPFTAGVACDQCSGTLSGSPLVRTTTAFDGRFTLRNVPVGSNIPLVLQIGRWRRQIVVPSVPSCMTTAVPATLTRLPRSRSEGDIPLMAISTGALDTPECVLRKIGIADTEFTAPTGAGRIHLYRGLTDPSSGADGGATLPGAPLESQLWGTQAALNRYDAVLFGCQGAEAARTAQARQVLVNYVNAGGRVLADHYGYTWLYATPPFSTTATWNVDQTPPMNDPQIATIDRSFARGAILASWLQAIGAASGLGIDAVRMQSLRHDLDAVVAPARSWMTISDPLYPNASLAYSFNAPVGVDPTLQCGRVTFDEFHPQGDVAFTTGMTFPAECVSGTMTPEEHVFEYLLFDLERCVEPDGAPPVACVPTTCTPGTSCGGMDDGCGNYLDCGACATGGICGGGGTENVCFTPCVPATCAAAGAACGTIDDGCGGTRLCGGCAVGATCTGNACVGG